MFTTRLNPTRPPAAHRVVLERVGMACRELRPVEESCYLERTPNRQIAAILAGHGVLGLGIDLELGGLGRDALLSTLAAERVGREGSGPLGFFLAQTTGAATISRWGSEPQKQRYLVPGVRGECSLGCALAEAAGDSDTAANACRFEPTSSGYLLNGTKCWVSRAEGNGALITLACHSTDRLTSAFLVDVASPGLTARQVQAKLGLPTLAHWEYVFQDCEVARADLLGESSQGPEIARDMRRNLRLGRAAGTIGIIADCLEQSAAQLARWPTSDQSHDRRVLLERLIAQMAVDLEATRALVYAAAQVRQELEHHPGSRTLELEADTLILEAKLFADAAVQRAASAALQCLGTDSHTFAQRPARHYCDTRAASLLEDSTEAMELRVAEYYLSP